MLETIREYAADSLAASGEEATVRGRHALAMLGVVEHAEQAWGTAAEPQWIERLEVEYGNCRAALDWSLDGGDSNLGVLLASGLGAFWDHQGLDYDAIGRLEKAAAVATADFASRARIFSWLSWFRHVWQDRREASRLAELSLGLARQSDDRHALADVLAMAGLAADAVDEREHAAELYQESLAEYRRLGDMRYVAAHLGGGGVLGCLGTMMLKQGEVERGIGYIEEALTVCRRMGNRDGIARLLNSLGEIAREQGEFLRAATMYAEALGQLASSAHRGVVGAISCNLGLVLLRQGEPRRAGDYLRQGLALHQLLGAPPGIELGIAGLACARAQIDQTPESTVMAARVLGFTFGRLEQTGVDLERTDRDDLDYLRNEVWTRLGGMAFDLAAAEGRAMTLDQAIAYALENTDEA